jgi:hypothetical protein
VGSRHRSFLEISEENHAKLVDYVGRLRGSGLKLPGRQGKVNKTAVMRACGFAREVFQQNPRFATTLDAAVAELGIEKLERRRILDRAARPLPSEAGACRRARCGGLVRRRPRNPPAPGLADEFARMIEPLHEQSSAEATASPRIVAQIATALELALADYRYELPARLRPRQMAVT